MKKTLLSIAVSISMSAGLYFSTGDYRTFMYALTWIFVALSVIALLTDVIKGDVAVSLVKSSWYNWPLTALAIAATLGAGYPFLAVIRLAVSVIVFAVASNEAGKVK